MRKCLLFVFLLCLHNMARGQTTFDYEYWFDNDRSTLHTGTSSTGAWQIEADLDGLTCSFHTIHLQVRNSEGVYSSPVSRQFVKLAPSTNTLTGHYWFDNDPTTMKTSDVLKGTFVVDMSTLREGFHTFHYQATDNQGSASSVVSAIVYKTLPNSEVGTFHCWFDNDETTQQGNLPVSDVAMLDVSQLTDGFHIVHVQADGITPTVARSYYFIKQPQTKGVEYITLVCTIDDVLYKQEKVANTGGVLLWNFDTSSLKQGLHRIQVLGVTPSGAATSAYSTFFLRSATDEEIGDMKLYYYVDNDNFNLNEGTYANGGFHFDVDVSQFTDGLHRLAYFMSNGKGITTKVSSKFFWKTPVGGNGITEYWYWMNEQGDNQATKVVLPERTNPLSLITLLPVESRPIRSSLFEFKVKDGQPTIYAKNDIHIRFYDASGRFTDVSKQFVDEGVKKEITDAELLEANVPTTFIKPEENAIKWFKVAALRGDSLAFRTRQACTLQLFSPSGIELYNASSPEVLKYGGSFAPEDGTYYIAIHDAKSQNNSNITVEYQHIGKYVVLSYTPKETGVAANYFYMKLDGNGYDKLQSASLWIDDNEIKASKITVKSKSLAELQFILSGDETIGDYDLVLNFMDEEGIKELTVSDAVKFTTADWGDFAIKVVPSRRARFPYEVKVTIKNTGNVSKLYVPFNIGASLNQNGKNVRSWTSMYTMNFDVLFDSETESEECYSPYTLTDNLIGTGRPGVVLHGFIPEIGPGETKNYIIGFVGGAHAKFNLYAWTGKALNEKQDEETQESNIYSVWDYLADLDSIKALSALSRSMRKAPNLDGVNAALDLADEINERAGRTARNTIGVGLTIGGIENGLRLRNIHAYTDGDDFAASVLADYEASVRDRMPTPGQIAEVAGMPEWLRWLLGLQDDQSRCDNPPVHSQTIDIYAPGDPNDILGYTSESGSKYMKEGTTDFYYTIEFENDPEIANASAHTIVVTDTLDASRFDLSTFAATSIKIGNKEAVQLDRVKTIDRMSIDLRPEIDVVAQVSLSYDETKGIAKWTIESLDPMTMEPTLDAMQGVLPVNLNGNGQGELTFDIKLKPGMIEGESVSNRAGIVFDQEGTIMTPTWTNTVDATQPEGRVVEVTMATDTTAYVKIEAYDELSKPWCYDLYVQEGIDGNWQRLAVNIPVDSLLQVPVKEGVDYGFYVVVTDSAGNVEQKETAREFTLEVFGSQIDTNTTLQLAEGWNWTSHNQQEVLALDNLKAKATRIVGQTEELYKDSRFGWMGDLDELLPTQMYKVQMAATDEVQLSGKLFNAGFRSIPLHMGWNWIGYPVANVMSPTEALAKMDAQEGEVIIGQDGMSTFSDGHWTGTLEELHPGQGYMFLSLTDKNLFFNATAQASSRRANLQYTNSKRQLPEGWAVDKRKYPNVMGVVAQLCQNGSTVESDDWLVGAFCGNECRGVAQQVDDMLMMNVYGKGSEQIVFRIIHRESGEVVGISDNEDFGSTLLGTMHQPYILNIGQLTGIKDIERSALNNDNAVYDLQGRKVDAEQTAKGVYIVTDGSKSETQKVVRK